MLHRIERTDEIIAVLKRISLPDHTIPSFEDVLRKAGAADNRIGEGLFYNTQPSTSQLAAALDIRRNEKAAGIINNISLSWAP